MPTSQIAISVIIPCFNGARFLEATIRSALDQVPAPLEVIVIDDGSTDESASIAGRFGPPVRVLQQRNQGESIARNRGIATAVGTHALFLDADDLLAPEALFHLSNAVKDRPDAVGLMGAAWFTTDPGKPTGIKMPAASSFLPAIIAENLAPPHAWLAPVDLIRRAGGFCEPLRWFEDWDLWWRVALFAPPLVNVNYVGALYRQHPNSQLATTKMIDRTRGHAKLMERMSTAFLEKPGFVEKYGNQLFWSAWVALSRAHANRVPWSELERLAGNIRQIAALRPEGLAGSRFAALISALGCRTMLRAQAVSSRLFGNRSE